MTVFGKLTRREEFTAARKGRRAHTASFTAQILRREPAGDDAPRYGLTVTKKVGDAVERNRIKRRLRAAVAAANVDTTAPASDYVFIAKREALTLPFPRLAADVATTLATPAPRRAKSSPGA